MKTSVFIFTIFILDFVKSYPAHEIETLRTCNKILEIMIEDGYDGIYQVLKSKPDLDQIKLEKKIISDILESCSKRITPEIIGKIWNKRTGRNNISSYKNFIRISPENYKRKDDLEVPKRLEKLIDIMHKSNALEPKFKNPNDNSDL